MREWLKNKRVEKGITMKTIAEQLGISESYYCAIENGDRQKKMNMMLISGLSVALGIPVSEIVQNEMEILSSTT